MFDRRSESQRNHEKPQRHLINLCEQVFHVTGTCHVKWNYLRDNSAYCLVKRSWNCYHRIVRIFEISLIGGGLNLVFLRLNQRRKHQGVLQLVTTFLSNLRCSNGSMMSATNRSLFTEIFPGAVCWCFYEVLFSTNKLCSCHVAIK